MEFNFEENGTVESLDKVPEKYRGLYVQGDEGKFVISEGAAGLVADYVGTSKTLASVKKDKTNASNESAARRQALKAFEELAVTLGLEVNDDDVAGSIKTFIEDLQGQVKGGKELKINLDKINGDWQKRFDELEATKNNEIAERDTALAQHLVSDAASRALAEEKGSIDLLLPHVKNHCKVVRLDDGKYTVQVLDEQGDARSDGAGGLMTVSGLVKEMKTKDAFARAFESETPGGTGSKPGALSQQAPRQQTELSPQQKIAAGLKKGQHVHGAGAR